MPPNVFAHPFKKLINVHIVFVNWLIFWLFGGTEVLYYCYIMWLSILLFSFYRVKQRKFWMLNVLSMAFLRVSELLEWGRRHRAWLCCEGRRRFESDLLKPDTFYQYVDLVVYQFPLSFLCTCPESPWTRA